jgi:HAD superfamily hydrolase (TIGR01509 family)
MVGLIIFDFDGVIADSELLANELLAETLTEYGRPTTREDSMRLFMGRRWTDNLARIAEHLGRPLPADFEERHRARARPRMLAEVQPVTGAIDFIGGLGGTRACIASSSSVEWLTHTTQRFGLADRFDGALFSAAGLARGKPAPDIFLHAAERMGADPARTVVIEDSQAGIEAARAAGMTAVGLLAGTHIGPGHAEALAAAGAHHAVGSYAELPGLLRSSLGWSGVRG